MGLESCFSDRFFTGKLFLFSKTNIIKLNTLHTLYNDIKKWHKIFHAIFPLIAAIKQDYDDQVHFIAE